VISSRGRLGQLSSNEPGHTPERKLTVPDLDSPARSSYVFLAVGIFLISCSAFYVWIGKASARFSWVYRAKEPGTFWSLIVMYFLGGLLFIGIFLLN
jgi:hypothetical protein